MTRHVSISVQIPKGKKNVFYTLICQQDTRLCILIKYDQNVSSTARRQRKANTDESVGL